MTLKFECSLFMIHIYTNIQGILFRDYHKIQSLFFFIMLDLLTLSLQIILSLQISGSNKILCNIFSHKKSPDGLNQELKYVVLKKYMVLCLEYNKATDLLCILTQMGKLKKKKNLMLLIKGIFSIKSISPLHMNLK